MGAFLNLHTFQTDGIERLLQNLGNNNFVSEKKYFAENQNLLN